MDQSSCQSFFTESEIRRFLDENTLIAYENLRIHEDLRQVALPSSQKWGCVSQLFTFS